MSFFEDLLKRAAPEVESAGPLASAVGSVILGEIFQHGVASTPAAPGATPDQSALTQGLGGLISKLDQAGLGDVARSWIANGANQPIDANKLGAVLGQDAITVLAAKTGLSSDMLQSELAKYLPLVVDRLTPHGQLP
jgi:uncharacterized protein YidB (DUF937 family)